MWKRCGERTLISCCIFPIALDSLRSSVAARSLRLRDHSAPGASGDQEALKDSDGSICCSPSSCCPAVSTSVLSKLKGTPLPCDNQQGAGGAQPLSMQGSRKGYSR